MRKYILICLTSIVVILGCSHQNSEGNAEKDVVGSKDSRAAEAWKHLSRSEYEISYPADWQVDESKSGGTTFILFGRSEGEGKIRENINLLIQDLSGLNFDLNQFVELSEQQVKTIIPNGRLIESKRINRKDDECHLIIYEGDQGEFRLKWKQFYWVKKDRAYILTFTGSPDTYDDFIHTVDRILDSFIVKDA